MSIEPSQSLFRELEKLKAARVNGSIWAYSPEFVESVQILNKKGLPRFRGANLARKASSTMATTLVAYKFKDRRSIENLLSAYINFTHHLERLKLPVPRHPENLVYALWYLDDHQPEVEA
jgi:hypothetical protein